MMSIKRLLYKAHNRGFKLETKYSLESFPKIKRPKIFLKIIKDGNLRFIYKDKLDNKRKTVIYKPLSKGKIWYGSTIEHSDLIILMLNKNRCTLLIYKDCWRYRIQILAQYEFMEVIIS